MATGGQHGLRLCCGRLLDETADGEHARQPSEHAATFDPAIAGLRDATVLSRRSPASRPLRLPFRADGGEKEMRVEDKMIGRTDPQQRLGAPMRPHVPGREADRSRGVPRQRLEQEMLVRGDTARLQLPTDQHHLRRCSDRYDPIGRRDLKQPPCGRLQQRLASGQLDEMLRERSPAHRPKSGAGTSCQDHRHDERVEFARQQP